MFSDARQLPQDAVIEAEICIIGGGAAGITLAREFVDQSVEVLLIESGGLEFDSETQSLYEGTIVGRDYFDLDIARLRFFGGSTNHWGGMCITLDKIDFEKRPWVPYSGWPITKEDLDPYYERANAICALGPKLYDERLWTSAGYESLPFDPARVCTNFWQFSREPWEGFDGAIRFGEAYGDELKNAENVTVLLHANVVNLQADDDARSVRHLDIRTLEGTRAEIRGKVFILCCGGIENARLLLVSNTVERQGLGNKNDLVGRFFMEHPQAPSAQIAPDGARPLVEQFGELLTPDGTTFRAAICLSAEAQRRERVLNGSGAIDVTLKANSGPLAARLLWRDLRRGRILDDLGDKLWQMTSDLGPTLHYTYRRFIEQQPVIPPFKEVYVLSRSEQAPNPDSRIVLSDERDALGMPKVRLDWRLTELDKRTVQVMTKAIGVELARLNLARAKLDDWVMDRTDHWHEDAAGGSHQMGTTRMADDPKTGVVDKNCQVHDIQNLYIAGSSVFPTGGYANPTLTIVALTLRLADHLKSKLAQAQNL